MAHHFVRNAVLGIPLAALSFGRAAEAASPVTPEVYAPPAATQVMNQAELAQTRFPIRPQDGSPPAQQQEQSKPSFLHRVFHIMPLVIGIHLLMSSREQKDRSGEKRDDWTK